MSRLCKKVEKCFQAVILELMLMCEQGQDSEW